MSIANELITRGWTQGTYEDTEGRVCLGGASWVAAESWRDFSAAVTALFNALPADVTCGTTREWATICIGDWNDHPARTFDEVLRVAKEADEILDSLS